MSIKKISKDQPEKFEFNDRNIELAKKMINNYPEGKQQSAVMSLLYIAQRQNNNWIPLAVMKYILYSQCEREASTTLSLEVSMTSRSLQII